MNMKKKVLVIGANGFTGRRILNDLSRNDEYIVTGCSLHDDIAPDSGNYRFISADTTSAAGTRSVSFHRAPFRARHAKCPKTTHRAIFRHLHGLLSPVIITAFFPECKGGFSGASSGSPEARFSAAAPRPSSDAGTPARRTARRSGRSVQWPPPVLHK